LFEQNILEKRKSFCFVSETGQVDKPIRDPSVRYRCYHPAETLSYLGHDSTVLSAAQFFKDLPLNHDVYVFHRPSIARPGFEQLCAALRQMGAILVADYDDLIFGNEDFALASSIVKNGSLSEEKAIAAFRSNLAALYQFDKVTTSTEPLAARVREFNSAADVRVAPNFIPESVLSMQKANCTHFLRRAETTIGYFAGTKSHDKDFPIVEAALHRVLCENSDLRLLIVGPVAVPRCIAAMPNVNIASVVDYLRLPSLMSMCSKVIAPLEGSYFNDCKSRVKFLEAALSGCQLIATPIPDMQVIGNDHLLLAQSTDDWYEMLSHPLREKERLDLAKRNFEFLERNSKFVAIEALTV